ncbi:MAG: DUF1616 domain-containing protein [Dehalococcoidales bacterium]
MVNRSSLHGKAMTAVLVAAVVAAVGILGYTIAHPPQPERYTEFYLLGLEEKAASYPEELVLGEEARVIVGIVNREQQVQDYYLEVRSGDLLFETKVDIHLQQDGKWEKEVVFMPARAGMQQKIEFLLYKQGHDRECERLYLWVDVYEGRISGKGFDAPVT